MTMEYVIEAAMSEDFLEITMLWESSVRASHHFLTENDIAHIRPLLLSEYLYMVDLKCIRQETRRIIGFSGVAEGKIEMLFVHPAWFGKGVGKSLLQYAVHQQHATQVDVNEQNIQALAFYVQMGFQVTGRSETDSLGKSYPLLHMHLPLHEAKGCCKGSFCS